MFGGGGFVRLTGATDHAHITRRQIGMYVLFDQYNGAYSRENFGLHREVHMTNAEREPITGVWGHRRTGTPTFWTGVPYPTFKDVGEEFAVIRGDLQR